VNKHEFVIKRLLSAIIKSCDEAICTYI